MKSILSSVLLFSVIVVSAGMIFGLSYSQNAFAVSSGTFPMYNFGYNPSYCTPTTANYNAAQPSGTATIYTNDGGATYNLHIQIHNAVVNAPYEIDERCVFTIVNTGITADGSGNINATISIDATTANAVLSGQHLIDLGILSGSGPGGTGDTFISGPLVTPTPPTASITSPVNGATVSSSTVTITGTASSLSNTISSVQVSIDGTPYAAATGTTSWTYTANGLANGIHSITAKAVDNQGLIGYSTNVVTGTTIPTGNGQELVFDPTNGNIYVANIAQGTISEISSTTNQVINTISGLPGPTGIAYDSVNGYLYTANYNSNDVSVVDTATNHIVATISAGIGIHPFGVAYVPNGDIYVANTGSNSVSVINPATNTVVNTIPVGVHAQDFTYDSANHLLYMTNQGSHNVSVIDPSSNTVVNTINVGNSPRGLVYDPANGKIYVANFADNTVSIIDTSNNNVSTIPTGSSGGPNGVAFDPANGFVYVPDFSGTRLNVIDSTTNTFINPVTLPSAPYYYYATFDPINSDIYITSGTNVAIIQTQTQFTVAIPQDTTPPVVTVPSPITTSATNSSGAVVTFITSATDPDDAAGPVQCNPAPGSIFPVGTTTVTCTSTDTHSNTGSAQFTVTISSFLQEKQGVIPSLQAITPVSNDDKQDINQAIKAVQDSVNASLWQSDGIHLVVKKGDKVFDDEKQAVDRLQNIIEDKRESSSTVTTLQSDISTLTDVDQKLATTAISDANTASHGYAGDNAKDVNQDIAEAQKEMTAASNEISKEHFAAGIEHYGNAWKHAEDAITDTTQSTHDDDHEDNDDNHDNK